MIYGQNQLVIPTVASGTKINASHMQLLLTALKFAGQHQGTTILSPEDSILGEVGGLVGVDCSWNLAADTFAKLRVMGLEPRKLPDIVPANPVNSGKIGKLTTAEALASALMICNQTEMAEALMAIFKWGPAFLQLNSIFWK